MYKILLSTLFVGNVVFAQQQSNSVNITEQHKYLLHMQKEVSMSDDEQWQYEHTYDAHKEKITQMTFKRLGLDGNFSTQGIVGFTHDDKKRVTQQEEKIANTEGVLEKSSITFYDYDDLGRINSITLNTFDEDLNDYKTYRRCTFNYNEDNKTSKVVWEWYNDATSQLIPFFEDHYKYDDKGKLITYLRTTPNQENYVERRRYRYENDIPKGFLWQKFSQNNWIDHYEQVLEYANKDYNNVHKEINYVYDINTGTRRENSMFVYTYDENITEQETYIYREFDHYAYVFDNWFKNKNVQTNVRMYSFDHHPTVKSWKETKVLDSEYIKVNTLATIEPNKHTDNITVYPNPVINTFSLNTQEYEKIELYDLSGKLVKTFTKKQASYDISNLKRGVYLLTIIGETKKSIKLIKH